MQYCIFGAIERYWWAEHYVQAKLLELAHRALVPPVVLPGVLESRSVASFDENRAVGCCRAAEVAEYSVAEPSFPAEVPTTLEG